MPAHLRTTDLILGVLIAAAIIGAYTGAPFWLSAAGLLIVAAVAWLRPNEVNVLWYAATVGLPIPQGLFVIRLSIADLFILPVIVKGVLEWRRRPLAQSTMVRPLGTLLVVAALATFVGYARTGRWSSWALFNKDAGLLFQVAGFLVLIGYMRTREDLERLARWFVAGVSVANIAALIAVVAALLGFGTPVYEPTNSRLFGWMGNPSVTGGLLLTAAMIELGLLAQQQARTRGLIRWANLWLLGVSAVLTLSRSSWLSVAAAAASLLAILLLLRAQRLGSRLSYVGAVTIWFLVPTLLLAYILVANVRAGVALEADLRAEELREQLIGQCLANPALDICKQVQMSGGLRSRRRTSSRAGGAEVAGPLMNARGLRDRIAIVQAGWKAYTASTSSKILGIGLGTFYATSGADFGVPLIIHNTFAWFLVEFGPIGAIVILWVWGQISWNLWRAIRVKHESRYLAIGTAAAFAGLTAFCMFNEGLYQRQFWIVMLVADRLQSLARETSDEAPAVITASYAPLAG